MVSLGHARRNRAKSEGFRNRQNLTGFSRLGLSYLAQAGIGPNFKLELRELNVAGIGPNFWR